MKLWNKNDGAQQIVAPICVGLCIALICHVCLMTISSGMRVKLRPPHYSLMADGFAAYRDGDTFYLGRDNGLVHRSCIYTSIDEVIQASWRQYHHEKPKRIPVMVYMTRSEP